MPPVGERAREYQRRWRRETYQSRKLAQICCDCRATLQDDDGVRCVECDERDKDAKAARNQTDEGRAAAREYQAARRASQAALGLCIRCPRSADAGNVCKRCRSTANRAQAAYRARKAAGVTVLATLGRRREIKPAAGSLERYIPIDVRLGRPRNRILRALRFFDWICSTDLFVVLGLPDFDEADKTIRNCYASALSRMTTARWGALIERRGHVPVGWRSAGGDRNGHDYRLTDAGRAAAFALCEVSP